jgi:hypothetical protein
MYNIYETCQSRLGIADHALTHVVHVTTAARSLEQLYAQIPPSISLIHSVLSFFSDVAKDLYFHDFVWPQLVACTIL